MTISYKRYLCGTILTFQYNYFFLFIEKSILEPIKTTDNNIESNAPLLPPKPGNHFNSTVIHKQ